MARGKRDRVQCARGAQAGDGHADAYVDRRPAACRRGAGGAGAGCGQRHADCGGAGGSAGAGERGGGRGRGGLRRLGAHGPEGSRGALLRIADRIEQQARRLRQRSNRDNTGKPLAAVLNDEMPAIADVFRFFAGAAPLAAGPGRRRIPARTHQHHPPRPGRRGRLDRAVELPADDGGVEDRAGDRRRQHPGAEALRADAADRSEAGASRARNCCRRAW